MKNFGIHFVKLGALEFLLNAIVLIVCLSFSYEGYVLAMSASQSFILDENFSMGIAVIAASVIAYVAWIEHGLAYIVRKLQNISPVNKVIS